MFKRLLFIASVLFLALSSGPNIYGDMAPGKNAAILYSDIDPSGFSLPDPQVFIKGIAGYHALKEKGLVTNNKLTIIDFRYSSTKKRLWIIDLDKKKVLFQSLVAHGKKTGEEFARFFSNQVQSHQSSLGFFITGSTYSGKHGLSMRLDGVEKGINDRARERAIVLHGANYVSHDFIRKYGRLGRSLGCPSVPVGLHKEIINAIKDNSCLFVYYPDDSYEKSSSLLNEGLVGF